MVQVNGRIKAAYAYAVQLLNHNGLSLRDAVRATRDAKHMEINNASLIRLIFARLRAANAPMPEPDRPTELTSAKERDVADTYRYLSQCDAPVVHNEIDNLICYVYGRIHSVSSRFNNGKSGRDWIRETVRELISPYMCRQSKLPNTSLVSTLQQQFLRRTA